LPPDLRFDVLSFLGSPFFSSFLTEIRTFLVPPLQQSIKGVLNTRLVAASFQPRHSPSVSSFCDALSHSFDSLHLYLKNACRFYRFLRIRFSFSARPRVRSASFLSRSYSTEHPPSITSLFRISSLLWLRVAPAFFLRRFEICSAVLGIRSVSQPPFFYHILRTHVFFFFFLGLGCFLLFFLPLFFILPLPRTFFMRSVLPKE